MRRAGVSLLLTALLLGGALPAQTSSVLDPRLVEAMASAAPGERLEAYLVMDDALQPRALAAEAAGLSRRARREHVLGRLRDHAQLSLAAARALLETEAARDRAAVQGVLWVGNAIVFEAEPAVIERLATLPGVDRIRAVIDLPASAYQDAPAPALVAGATSAPYPFEDDFETGVLGPWWEVETAGAGYVAVSSGNSPIGDYHMVMASSVDNVAGTASATLTLDLTGQVDVGLRFAWKEFSDESNVTDGVFVSDDGVSWIKVFDLVDGTQDYVTKAIDLSQAIADNGFTDVSAFRVRFQWEDNFDIPTDGFAFDEVQLGPGLGEPPPPLPTENIDRLQAPQLWDLGFRGAGVLMGTIDSGVDLTHPDLQHARWDNPGEIPGNALDDDANGYVDDLLGWDFINDSPDTSSAVNDQHGTSTAGLMVGDGTNGSATGMAPEATLIVCEVEEPTEYWLAQQYLMDAGVDVISSSYSYKWPSKPDYHMFRQIVELELVLGIVHANSIGNQGTQLSTHPIPYNIATPGNAPGPFAHPDVADGGRTAVLGCGGILLDPLDVSYNSGGKGPAAWEDVTLTDPTYPWVQDPTYWDYPYVGGALPGLIKPDVVTYTASVKTTAFNETYADFSGTSAATPQLGGALALLRDVQPEAEPRHLAAAVELTAVDLGVPGKDDVFGAGKLQVYDAARRLVLLVRAVDPTPAIGGPVTLELFGEPGASALMLLSGDIVDLPGSALNLVPPLITLGSIPLDGAGEATLGGTVPNDPVLTGVTVWLQLGASPTTATWGNQVLASVPEGLTFE